MKIKILSLNIAGLTEDNPQIIKSQTSIFVAEINNRYQPDIILLQEYTNQFDIHNRLSAEYGHTCDVQKTLLSLNSNIILFKKSLANVVKVAKDCIEIDNKFRIISYRGAPFKQNAHLRQFEVEHLMAFYHKDQIPMPTNFAGDTNARRQDYDALKLSESFKDCWELQGNRENVYTVDGFRNKYFVNGHQYKSRYDRSYISAGIRCLTFELCFTQKYEELQAFGSSGCISDHYGILYDLQLEQGTENKTDSVIDLTTDDDVHFTTQLVVKQINLKEGVKLIIRLADGTRLPVFVYESTNMVDLYCHVKAYHDGAFELYLREMVPAKGLVKEYINGPSLLTLRPIKSLKINNLA